MKLVHRRIDRGNGWEITTLKKLPRIKIIRSKFNFSSVVLIPEESEDMWHAYNIIAAGDVVKASTIRKVCEIVLRFSRTF